ncbi:alpha/beta-hydrolase [Athelia psychrophila]|uniref:Alpha/beta-hydrolase n=1 Tax=Athelia psychrophila TaxID=1759441 RepID=A0A166X0Z7_9AGAM|nr:alpha/beta-hydrolase [Fibularhizoctonia sp. CBS 109695]
MSSTSFTESYLPGPQGTVFYTRKYTPQSATRAVLVFVHGFNEHIARFAHVHPLFAERGIALFAFDQRGFGQTVFHKDNGAGKKYAQTSWKQQLEDIEWAIKEARQGYENLPVFLMGHSMGGGLSLAFPTRTQPAWPHPSPETVAALSGVIVTSPFIILTNPPFKITQWAGTKAGMVLPGFNIPAVVKGEHLSHDPKVAELVNNDPLIRQLGSLKGVADMLGGGQALLSKDHKHWPKELPATKQILIIHGTDDQVTSHKASQSFYDAVVADDKKLSLYEGGYHELQNEPDGVPEKLTEECISWIEAHIPAQAEAAGATSKL